VLLVGRFLSQDQLATINVVSFYGLFAHLLRFSRYTYVNLSLVRVRDECWLCWCDTVIEQRPADWKRNRLPQHHGQHLLCHDWKSVSFAHLLYFLWPSDAFAVLVSVFCIVICKIWFVFWSDVVQWWICLHFAVRFCF